MIAAHPERLPGTVLLGELRAQTKGKVERFIHYLRHSFWVPLDSRLRPLGLKVDAATANVEVRKWLRDTANMRVHGTTDRIPQSCSARSRAASCRSLSCGEARCRARLWSRKQTGGIRKR